MPGQLSREIRQLVILGLLVEWRGSATVEDLKGPLWEEYPDDPASAHRRFSEDMQALSEAGLVGYESLRPRSPVRLVRSAKEPHLHLTRAEHDALQRAREATGQHLSEAGPLQSTGSGEKLAVVTALLRHIEEAGDAYVDDLRARTGMRRTRLRQLLRRLESLQGKHFLQELEVERGDISPSSGSPLETGAPLRAHKDDDHPLQGIGLDEFGLFAYTSAEVQERLQLIESALPLIGARYRDALVSARGKLQEWGSKLQEVEARSKS